MKRYIALGLGIIMLLGLIAGCSSTSSAPAATSAAATATVAGSAAATSTDAAPATKGAPVKITLFMHESDSQWKLSDTPNFKAIQKIILDKFNVDWELETALSKDFETSVTTLFASGTKLPDIIDWRYSDDKLLNLYTNGLIMKLNDLISQNAPNITELLKIRPYLSVANGDRSGNILRIPDQYIENPQHRIYVMFIRSDWLKTIGMTMADLKTPDDLEKALKAFQDKDVNGNGAKDEVLTAFSANEFNRGISSAFGVPNMAAAADSWYFDANGKVYNTFLTAEAKNYLTFMAKLYSENLIDPNFMNQTSDSYNAMLNNNKVSGKCDMWWGAVLANMSVRDKGFKDCDYLNIMPTLSAIGKPSMYLLDLPGYGGYMLTKDCTDPVAVMKVFDWGYSLEGSCQNYNGEVQPGGDYYEKAVAPAGMNLSPQEMQYTAKGKEAAAAEPQLWAKMGWNQEFTPKCLIGNADDIAFEFLAAFSNSGGGTAATLDINKKGLNDALAEGIPGIDFVSPTADQAQKLQGYTDLWKYMDEEISKFITGVEPMTNWDKFVAQCNTMGIADATSIKQDEYDNYKTVLASMK